MTETEADKIRADAARAGLTLSEHFARALDLEARADEAPRETTPAKAPSGVAKMLEHSSPDDIAGRLETSLAEAKRGERAEWPENVESESDFIARYVREHNNLPPATAKRQAKSAWKAKQ